MSGPVWMLRINPMARQRLADPELAGLLEQAAELEAAAQKLAGAADDDLYRLVPTADEAVRGRLLALRRDIHNDRARADDAPPVELPASVGRWLLNRQQRLGCRSRIRDGYQDSLARERRQLRGLLGGGDFQTTLAQSAPGVYHAARRYRRRPTVDSKDRKAERALVQYVTRAMVRTSPYGRFTAVGLARLDAAGTTMDVATAATARPHVEVDRAMFEYVIGGLVKRGRDPLIALPPTARVSDDAVTFFQVRPDAIRRLSAPMNRQTRLLVELLDLGPCRQSALASAMVEQLGVDQPTAERLLGGALGLGLLVTAWRGDDFVAQPVEAALDDLADTGDDETLEGLRRFQVDLGRFRDVPLGDTSGTAEPAEDRAAVQVRLETGGDQLSRRAGRPAKLMVNEDFVLDPLAVDPGTYQGALDDLAAVAELFWAFDRMHVVRALVAAALAERFGAGCQVPLVEHAEALVRATYRAEAILAEHPEAAIGPGDGSLAMLAKVRREAMTALHHGADGTADVQWAPGDVTALVADAPDRFRLDPASYGMVVQPDGADLVLNDTYAGHGPMVSRFLHADGLRGGTSVARLRARIDALYRPGARLVEDRGAHGLSINAHPPILEESLDPGGWRGLQLAHDAETDVVSIVDAGGAPVTVLALGAQLPELFPYPVRLATWLCSSGRVVLDVMAARHRQRSNGHGATVGYPRLRVGGVVVSRRRWYPGADFPSREDAADDIDHLVALTRWRARHDVPAEVMLKSLFDGPTRWESLSGVESRDRFFELRRHSKPQYVDLGSALMTRVLPRLMDRRPEGCIEEARPALAGGGHAVEWMVEMARPAGDARFTWRAP